MRCVTTTTTTTLFLTLSNVRVPVVGYKALHPSWQRYLKGSLGLHLSHKGGVRCRHDVVSIRRFGGTRQGHWVSTRRKGGIWRESPRRGIRSTELLLGCEGFFTRPEQTVNVWRISKHDCGKVSSENFLYSVETLVGFKGLVSQKNYSENLLK